MTSRVWGYVERGDATVAAYFVEWTPGHEEKHANFDLIVGKWGEDADASERQAIALEYLQFENGLAFRVADAASRKAGASSLVSKALDRDSVIGTPIAELVYAICDLIYLEDHRIAELRS